MVAPIGSSGLLPVPSTGARPADRGESGPAGGPDRNRRDRPDPTAAGGAAAALPQVEILRSDPVARGQRGENFERRQARPGDFAPRDFRDAGSRAERLYDGGAFDPRDYDSGDPRRSPYDGFAAARLRPRPSSQFLAQAIGQELDGRAGSPAGGDRDPQAVAGLYRQTLEAVDRALFRGIAGAPGDTPGNVASEA